MRKILFAILAVSLMACEKQLDIIPKGQSTLSTVEDLELLLNYEYWHSSNYADLGVICNESIGAMPSVPDVLSRTNTLDYAYLAYDESVNRKELTSSDARYNGFYSAINYMNTIIAKMGEVKGDESRKPSLIAEARIMRAYYHWLLVNIYAEQYDESTAADKGGIPYVTDIDVSVEKTKLSLQDTYAKILEDCSDEVIAVLPEKSVNAFRAGKAFGYAVRSKVLMQMKNYEDALDYALKALAVNGTIEDRSYIKDEFSWKVSYDYAGNYAYIHGSNRAEPFMESLSLETGAMFEPDDYSIKYGTDWNEMFGEMMTGLAGCKLYFGMNAEANVLGITSDRMYYTAAECMIRTGEIEKGLQYVDKVRAFRIENCRPLADNYTAAMTEEEAMALLQPAKWIECIATYENFFDCKRWNTEEKYRRTITRDLGEHGKYSISPDSPLWILPFPANATRYNASLTQNY